MNKLLTVALASMLLLAGCLDAEDAVDQIDELVDIIVPGCDDPEAYNYNNSSENSLACLSQEVLTASLSEFVLFMDNGPEMGDTAGLSELAIFQQTGMDGELLNAEVGYTVMVSPNGSAISQHMDLGTMGEFAQTWWAFPGTGNTTSIYVDYNGEEFMMTSAMTYAETMADFIGEDDMEDDDMNSGMDDNSADENTTDNNTSSEDLADLDTPEVDLTLYDWSSTNFTMELDLTNPEEMFNFAADVTVEGYTHQLDVKVNEALSVRAITVHYPDFNETVTLTLHTEAEVTAMLADGAMTGPATEALPFVLEGAYDMGMGTMASDAEGNPQFITLHDCLYLVEESRLTNSTHEDVVNSTTINDDMCGTAADAYTFAEGENLSIPFEVRFIPGGDDVTEGSAIVFHNTTSISTLWLMNEGNATTQDDCNESMGAWDAATSECTVDSWSLEAYDAGAIMVDGDVVKYSYDGANGVLLLMSFEDYYVCDDGEQVPADWYDDGMEDCADGSDEPNDQSNGHQVEFVDAYDCVFFVDAAVLNVGPNSSFFEVHDPMGLDLSNCGTQVENWGHNFTQSNVTVPLNLVFFDDNTFSFVNVTHDGANLTVEWANWTYNSNTIGDCTEDGGLYDNTTDVCHEMLNITNADGMALELYNAADNQTDLLLYDYNTSSMSGVFFTVQPKFVCDDGQMINDYLYDDMNLDCVDGSDEPGMDAVGINWEFIGLPVGEADEDGFEITFFSGLEDVDMIEIRITESYENDQTLIANWTVNTSDLNVVGNVAHYTLTQQTLVDTYMLVDECYIINAHIEYDSGNSSEAYGIGFCVGDADHGNEWSDDATTVWTVSTDSEMFAYSGDLNDYNIVLSDCEDMMTEDEEMITQCGEDVVSVSIASALMNTSEADAAMMDENTTVVFVDVDASGTITSGDQIGIPGDGGTANDWNTVRLHSTSADAYSDENPTLPGFTVVLATLALLGAIMVRREN